MTQFSLYLIAFGVLVSDPAAERVPVIFDGERFGELLSLAVAETALRLATGHQVRRMQINLQPLANVVLDGRTWAPGTATFLHPNPVHQKIAI